MLSKINIEETKWTQLSDLITTDEPVTLQILGEKNPNVQTFREANFKTLKEEEKNFKDPGNKNQNYPLAYAVWWTWKEAYKFIQIATISEKENKAVIKWNYYRSEDTKDAKSLFLTWWTTQEDWKELENWWETLPYPPKEWWNTSGWWKKFSCTWTLPENTEGFNIDNLTVNTEYQNTDENASCYFKCKIDYIWNWLECLDLVSTTENIMPWCINNNFKVWNIELASCDLSKRGRSATWWCPSWYRLASSSDWENLVSTWNWERNTITNMSNILLLMPSSHYWTSSIISWAVVNWWTWYYTFLASNWGWIWWIAWNINWVAAQNYVRCFKN